MIEDQKNSKALRVYLPMKGQVFLFFWAYGSDHYAYQNVFVSRTPQLFEKTFKWLWKEHDGEPSVRSVWYGKLVTVPEATLEAMQYKAFIESAESWRQGVGNQIARYHEVRANWGYGKLKDFDQYYPCPDIHLPEGVKLCTNTEGYGEWISNPAARKTPAEDRRHFHCPKCFLGYVVSDRPWLDLYRTKKAIEVDVHEKENGYPSPAEVMNSFQQVMVVGEAVNPNQYGVGLKFFQPSETEELYECLNKKVRHFLFQGKQIPIPDSCKKLMARHQEEQAEIKEERVREEALSEVFWRERVVEDGKKIIFQLRSL